MHKFNKVRFEERAGAKKDLQKPHQPPNSVPGIRARLDEVEKFIGAVAVVE